MATLLMRLLRAITASQKKMQSSKSEAVRNA
jgi:hypothetical protein